MWFFSNYYAIQIIYIIVFSVTHQPHNNPIKRSIIKNNKKSQQRSRTRKNNRDELRKEDGEEGETRCCAARVRELQSVDRFTIRCLFCKF